MNQDVGAKCDRRVTKTTLRNFLPAENPQVPPSPGKLPAYNNTRRPACNGSTWAFKNSRRMPTCHKARAI
ncbi:hypothetical protein EMIT0194MI4_30464 [Pseudomonas sp. IT-194MI4]